MSRVTTPLLLVEVSVVRVVIEADGIIWMALQFVEEGML